jgi:signal transduction histidine kinase
VRSRGKVYGNLYLTEKPEGFSETDEHVIGVLAAQAGAAVENAQLSERLRAVAVHDERERISRELHDGVIQSLFSIGMGLESARALIFSDPTRVDERLDAAVESLDGAIRQLRNSIFRLRPSEAASLGLAGGLAELAREYEVNALVRPDLHVQPGIEDRIADGVVADVLQIVREALSNVARHAKATQVFVAAFVEDDMLDVVVRDDGSGFTVGPARVGRGIDNARERAAGLGGRVSLDSTPGEGTVLRVRVPITGSGG